MTNKQNAITKTVLAILCAALVLTTGCSGAHASNKTELSGNEVSGEAQNEMGMTGEVSEGAQDEMGESDGTPEDNLGTTAVAEVPPLEETVTNEYVQKTVRVCKEEAPDGTAQLRFYKDAPNVAYMGIAEYFDLMLGGGLNVQDHGDGTYTLTNAAGAAASVDIGRDTVASENMLSGELGGSGRHYGPERDLPGEGVCQCHESDRHNPHKDGRNRKGRNCHRCAVGTGNPGEVHRRGRGDRRPAEIQPRPVRRCNLLLINIQHPLAEYKNAPDYERTYTWD